MIGSANGEAMPGPDDVAKVNGGKNTAIKCSASKMLIAIRSRKEGPADAVPTIDSFLPTMIDAFGRVEGLAHL